MLCFGGLCHCWGQSSTVLLLGRVVLNKRLEGLHALLIERALCAVSKVLVQIHVPVFLMDEINVL